MKVKVFICTLAFLHIKEEILMKRKNYKVKVKLIFETTMDHSQTSMQKAQEDVNRVLTDYLKDKKCCVKSIQNEYLEKLVIQLLNNFRSVINEMNEQITNITNLKKVNYDFDILKFKISKVE